MLSRLLFSVVCLLMFVGAYAQPPGRNHPGEGGQQKIKALYVAFITQQLKLTEDEAQKFWPVHMQFDTEMQENHKNQANALQMEEGALAIKKKYNDKFIKILGADRTNLFFEKDREFRHEMIGRLRDRMMKRRPGKRGGPHSDMPGPQDLTPPL
jgi:hypothetical protein